MREFSNLPGPSSVRATMNSLLSASFDSLYHPG